MDMPVANRSVTENNLTAAPVALAGARPRRTRQGVVSWGDHHVTVGGDAPVRVQSMTNTDTADAIGTAIQVKELAQAGSELVRITVNNDEAARAVPYIREQLDRMGIQVPLIGDFHYNGHQLLSAEPQISAEEYFQRASQALEKVVVIVDDCLDAYEAALRRTA